MSTTFATEVRSIPRTEFRQLTGSKDTVWVSAQDAWRLGDQLLGAVTFDRYDQLWGVLVWRRNARGEFLPVEQPMGYPDQAAAVAALQARLRRFWLALP